MPSCKKAGNVIFADWPNAVERKLEIGREFIDRPLADDDDGLTIPPFDSLNPFGSRARRLPGSKACDGAGVVSLPQTRHRPYLFTELKAAVVIAFEFYAFISALALPLLIYVAGRP